MKHQPKFQPQHPERLLRRWPRRPPAASPAPSRSATISRSAYYQLTANNRSDTAGFTNQPDYLNTGKMGDVYGDGIPLEVNDAPHGPRPGALQYQLRHLPRPARRRRWHRQERTASSRSPPCRTSASAPCPTGRSSPPSPTAKTPWAPTARRSRSKTAGPSLPTSAPSRRARTRSWPTCREAQQNELNAKQ